MNELFQRRGKIRLSGELIFKNPDEQLLKALFSIFYPVNIEPDNSYGWNRDVVYYGYSMLFEIVEEGIIIPQYDIQMQRAEDGTVSITAVNKIS